VLRLNECLLLFISLSTQFGNFLDTPAWRRFGLAIKIPDKALTQANEYFVVVKFHFCQFRLLKAFGRTLYGTQWRLLPM
jgi:hypothetical protein